MSEVDHNEWEKSIWKEYMPEVALDDVLSDSKLLKVQSKAEFDTPYVTLGVVQSFSKFPGKPSKMTAELDEVSHAYLVQLESAHKESLNSTEEFTFTSRKKDGNSCWEFSLKNKFSFEQGDLLWIRFDVRSYSFTNGELVTWKGITCFVDDAMLLKAKRKRKSPSKEPRPDYLKRIKQE